MPKNTSQSQQYKITQALITADRFGAEVEGFDVRTSIAELSLYESLDKPYLTGTVVMLDDKALYDKISFQGTERLTITMASVDNDLSPVMERTFIMTGIERQVKSNSNGKSSMIVFTLLDEHAFLSSLKKISKSFNGRIDEILIKLLATELGLDIDLSYLFLPNGKRNLPLQSNMKGIIPNLTPIDAIKWLTQRATTVTGSPFFTYASMHDTNLRLGNLDAMLKQPAFNEKLPYTYNPANVAGAETQTEFEKTFIIKAFTVSKQANTLKLIQDGAIASTMQNTNLNTGLMSKNHHSVRDVLKKLVNQTIIGDNQNVFDKDFIIGGKPVDEHSSHVYHTITSSGTYGRFKSYHDEYTGPKLKKKLERRSILNHLYKNMMSVTVEGAGFIISKAGVGDVINLMIANDNTESSIAAGKEELVDKSKSGDHIIYDTRHTFRGTKHEVVMNVAKLERLDTV